MRVLVGVLVALFGGLAVYYALPVSLGIISLGEICLYSPAGINLCETSTVPTTIVDLPPGVRTSPEPAGAKLCRKRGIRYAGTTAEGGKVCFTLTPDRSKWVEIGFKFVGASGCGVTGDYRSEGLHPLTGPGRITEPGFTATIGGARASGVLENTTICPGKTFEWSARRQP